MASTSISSSPSDLELLNTAALLLRLTPEDKERLIEQTTALAQEDSSPYQTRRRFEDESPIESSSKTTTASSNYDGSNESRRDRFDDALKAFSDAYIAALLTGEEVVPNLSSMLGLPPEQEQRIPEGRAPPPRLPGDARLFGNTDYGRVTEPQTPTTHICNSFSLEEQQMWTNRDNIVGGVGRSSFPSSGDDTTGRASVKSAAGMSFQKIQCFKTKQCRFWLDGRCTRGDECTFAHCDGELREKPDLTKTKICAKWRAGQCDKPDVLCSYAHGVGELRQVQADSREDARSQQAAWWPPAMPKHW